MCARINLRPEHKGCVNETSNIIRLVRTVKIDIGTTKKIPYGNFVSSAGEDSTEQDNLPAAGNRVLTEIRAQLQQEYCTCQM